MAKLKKLLKKAGKAAALGAALYGATKLGRKRATDAPGNAMAKARRLMTSDDAYLDDTMPGNLSSDMGSGNRTGIRVEDPHRFRYPMNFKKGGRVTGIAKRGFGRALMKGKK